MLRSSFYNKTVKRLVKKHIKKLINYHILNPRNID